MQISVSVLAARDEIRDWLAYQSERFELHFALIRYQPSFHVVPLANWAAYDDAKDDDSWREVWIDIQPMQCECRGQLDCTSRNPDRLALQLPDTRPEGLREGSLGTLSEDECRLRVWRAIIRYFRGKMPAGAWVVNETARAMGYYKTVRCSPGIAALHRQGLALLPFAGSNRIFLDKPSD